MVIWPEGFVRSSMAETRKVPGKSKGTTTADWPLGEFIPFKGDP